MTKETGGPAFPTSDWDENDKAYKMHGMTLRDYFAANAMPWVAEDMPAQENFLEIVADKSYRWADAMLKAREA